MTDLSALSADQLAEKVLLLMALLADPRTPSEADRAYREAKPLIGELRDRASERDQAVRRMESALIAGDQAEAQCDRAEQRADRLAATAQKLLAGLAVRAAHLSGSREADVVRKFYGSLLYADIEALADALAASQETAE